jgi:hypothetical protein
LAQRSSATFAKRQKERARQEKQEEKRQRKLQRGMEKRESVPGSESLELGLNAEAPSPSEPTSDTTIAAAEAAATQKESQ